jgi:serine/threonine-protein kinase HipA
MDERPPGGSLVRIRRRLLICLRGKLALFRPSSPNISFYALRPAEDRELFFKAQIAFWLLCAIDGHAKNFSLSILPLGRFKLAPLYDVLSAYPIIGHGVGKLPKQKATMAMAVWGKNRHYNWDRIFKRHWLKTAKDCGIPNPEDLISDLCSEIKATAKNIEESLPEDVPEQVAIPVLEGLLKASSSLNPLDA